MKNLTITAVVWIAVFFYSFKVIENATWSVDKSHAKLGFTITHLMISDVDGYFKTFDATVSSSKEDFSDAEVIMSADVNSINTESEQRDKHLKSADFFDAEKYSLITFKSTSFKKAKGDNYKVKGDLTMHGITKEIILNAVCKMDPNPMSKLKICGFKITGEIKRSVFNIGTTMPSTLIGDDVLIMANAEFIRK